MPFLAAIGPALAGLAGTGVPTALGTSALSGLGTAIAGSAEASAMRRAQRENLALARENNAANLNLFNLSRGSEGSAILPQYLRGLESAIGSGAANLAALGLANPSQTVGSIAESLAPLGAAIAGSTGAVNDLFSGANLRQRLGALAPVSAARTTQARTRFDTINQSLDEVLGRLNAAASRRGFGGTSSFDRQQLLGATLGARQQAAEALSAADLQNAMDAAALRDADVQARLANVGLPFQQAGQLANFANLPFIAAGQRASAALQPLDFFRLGTAAFQNQPLPAVQPTIGSAGQIGGALAGLGQNLGQYFQSQNTIRALQQLFGGGTPTGTTLPAIDWGAATIG